MKGEKLATFIFSGVANCAGTLDPQLPKTDNAALACASAGAGGTSTMVIRL